VENLDKDRAFFKNGGVFDDDFINSFIELKMTEVERFEMTRTRSSSTCTIRSNVARGARASTPTAHEMRKAPQPGRPLF